MRAQRCWPARLKRKGRYFQFPTVPGSMNTFVKGMVNELAERKVPILKGLRAKEIVMDGDRAAGIRAEYVVGKDKGKKIAIKARSVVIATGGFVNNKEMMIHYKRYWSTVDIGFTGLGDGMAMDHTGDGILMGRDIGAALEDMESMPKFYNGTYDKSPSISWIMFDVDKAYFIAPDGKRMLNEFVSRYTGCLLALMQRGIKEGGRILFDEETFNGPNRDRWNIDKVMEVDGILKADTPEELAKLAGLRPEDAQGNHRANQSRCRCREGYGIRSNRPALPPAEGALLRHEAELPVLLQDRGRVGSQPEV
mgnify:CR=1 FL=1